MGIYWVYFKSNLGHHMKLQIEADDRVDAIKSAETLAKICILDGNIIIVKFVDRNITLCSRDADETMIWRTV